MQRGSPLCAGALVPVADQAEGSPGPLCVPPTAGSPRFSKPCQVFRTSPIVILHIALCQDPLYTSRVPRPRKYQLKPLERDTEPIGTRLKHFRKLKGFTQAEIAAKIGITRGALAAYEAGRVRVVDELIVRFALALSVSADKLLGIAAQRSENPSALRIMRRLKKIERLPPAKQKAILQTLDMALQNVEPEKIAKP